VRNQLVTRPDIQFLHVDGSAAASLRPEVEDLYRRSYVERIARGDEFGRPEAFMRRFDAYVTNPSFAMVVASFDGRWIGQAWGWPLTRTSRWWTGLRTDEGSHFTHEDGRRTFALSEIMVDQAHTGRGVAHALHDRLLAGRPEERATLLVNPANTTARCAYERWGWVQAGTLRPSWPGAAELIAMVRPLMRRAAAE
jgi:GNAT superfamily N-acetyltransferase